MEKLKRVPVDEGYGECCIRYKFYSDGKSMKFCIVRAREIEFLVGPKFNKDDELQIAHHNKYGMMRHSAFDVCSSKTTGSYESHSYGRHGLTIRGWTNTTRGVLRHDANSDTSAVLDQIQTLYPGGIVPFYRFAPAVKSGELSGKISWPNDATNPNFAALMVHESLDVARRQEILYLLTQMEQLSYDGSRGDENLMVCGGE